MTDVTTITAEAAAVTTDVVQNDDVVVNTTTINNNNNPNVNVDENLPNRILVQSDPRGNDPSKRITKKASKRGGGRNTESFDPSSTFVRPAMRVRVGNPTSEKYNHGPLKHDDVVIVPELFGPEENWDIYYKLVNEITDLQESNVKNSNFISWHEGAHLICKSPDQSPTFKSVVSRLCDYFDIDPSSSGTRFNWYKDSLDWKPFHHDSAAFNPKRAKTQNITVGVSFGASRELAFIRAAESNNANNNNSNDDPVRLYFPQTNNGVFTFGRDVNILWKHGVNALKPNEQDGKGRISIILWGLARNVIEEDGSPPLLGSDGKGPHASSSSMTDRSRNHNNNGHHRHHSRHRHNDRDRDWHERGGRGGRDHGHGHGRDDNNDHRHHKKRRFEDNNNNHSGGGGRYDRQRDDHHHYGRGDGRNFENRREDDDRYYRHDDRDRREDRYGGRDRSYYENDRHYDDDRRRRRDDHYR